LPDYHCAKGDEIPQTVHGQAQEILTDLPEAAAQDG